MSEFWTQQEIDLLLAGKGHLLARSPDSLRHQINRQRKLGNRVYTPKVATIEDLHNAGRSIDEIVRETGRSKSHVYKIVSGLRLASGLNEARVNPKKNAEHVRACLAQGGFPASVVQGGRTVWMWPGRRAA